VQVQAAWGRKKDFHFVVRVRGPREGAERAWARLVSQEDWVSEGEGQHLVKVVQGMGLGWDSGLQQGVGLGMKAVGAVVAMY
jgi:hypothetical protein